MTQSIFDSTDLPTLQPRTHCVLIPRDPNFIYAYWDYTQEDIDRLRNQFKFEGGDSQLVLRVYDISLVKFNGSNANHTWDLDVGYSNKNWYIHVWQDNAEYCVELGLRSSENHFVVLTRSNIVTTPPKTSSKRNDLIWQDIKAHSESRPYLKENIKERYEGLIQKQGKKKLLHVKQSRKPRVYQLTLEDIRDYYMKLFNWVSPRGRSKTRAKAQIPSMEDILKRSPGNIFWQKVKAVVTSPQGRTPQGASMGLLDNKGASENLLGSKSGASEGRLNNRKFFFEVWAELIVHGRTEADATVWLNTQGVKLNPDGTFSLRYSLPDGEIPFKFIAQSSDGIEQRHIYTHVEREKTIGFPKMLKAPHG